MKAGILSVVAIVATGTVVAVMQPPQTRQVQAVVTGPTVTVPQISGSDCLARYSGTHILAKSFVTLLNPAAGEGVSHWTENIEGCPSSLIHYTLLPNGESSLTFNSPARGPMASVPFAAIYAGTGGSLRLVSVLEGTGWPGSLNVQ